MRNDVAVLTDKQKMFCKEYMIDLNATQACIRAGYSKKTAKVIGSQNLSKLNIQEEITKLMKKREDKVELTAEKVLKDIERVREKAEDSDQYNVSLKASELQGKHLAMFTEKQQIEADVKMPIIHFNLNDD
jgi:phage terminase small subunit